MDSVLLIATFFLNIITTDAAIGCRYEQQVALGEEYYIYNKEYPSKYYAFTSCSWYATSPLNSRIVVTCEDIDLPASENCNLDRLSISLTGNRNFVDSHNYCGKGTLSVVSEENAIAVGLFSGWNSPGGKFVCAVTAIQESQPPTTTKRPISCDCGWKHTTRIVGGRETGVNEFPFMSALVNFIDRDLFCGSSIISNRYVLTAAHCLSEAEPKNFGILVGDHNLSTGSDTPYAKVYGVQSFKIFPEYQSDSLLNDMAVVKTVEIIQFSLFVGPICLPFKFTSDTFYGQTVTALGWGTEEYSGPKSQVLQEVNLKVVTNRQCRQSTGENITLEQLCTYAPGKDSCQSDSGGPVIWMDTNTRRLQLIGVISYGLGCATLKPSVNTRVSSYLSWIISQTNDANYCIK